MHSRMTLEKFSSWSNIMCSSIPKANRYQFYFVPHWAFCCYQDIVENSRCTKKKSIEGLFIIVRWDLKSREILKTSIATIIQGFITNLWRSTLIWKIWAKIVVDKLKSMSWIKILLYPWVLPSLICIQQFGQVLKDLSYNI